MRKLICLLAVSALASVASASVDFFFTSGGMDLNTHPYGLKTPALAFTHSLENGYDLRNGYELYPSGAAPNIPPYTLPGTPMEDVTLQCGAQDEWAYIWARFNGEPGGVQINGISIGVRNVPAGQGNIAWYTCNNLKDPAIAVKRWDGDPEVFYFNPTGLIAITAFGVKNLGINQPWNLYVGTPHRLFLLGAVKCPAGPCPQTLELYFPGATPVNYGGTQPPPNPSVNVLNKVVCIPEPAALMLLGVAGLLLRRR